MPCVYTANCVCGTRCFQFPDRCMNRWTLLAADLRPPPVTWSMRNGTEAQQSARKRRWRDETERKRVKAQGETLCDWWSGCESDAHKVGRGATGARIHSHCPLPTSVSSGSAWGLRDGAAGTPGWELRRGTHTDVSHSNYPVSVRYWMYMGEIIKPLNLNTNPYWSLGHWESKDCTVVYTEFLKA